MIINLESIYTDLKDTIDMDEDIVFDQEIYHIDEIKDLKDVHWQGKIVRDSDDELSISGKLFGIMTILDSISLEKVDFKFSIDISENIEEFIRKDKNTIDILEILWQNIVLEVPLRYTEVTDYSKYSGDGWRLISEEELNYKNNPFQALLENEKEE